MWRSADGVLHTVALPDPAQAFTDSSLIAVLTVLDGLPAGLGSEVLEELAMECVALWQTDDRPVEEAEEQRFHAVAVHQRVFTALPVDRASLQAAVAKVHARWQLDVVLAMQDLLDDADDDADADDATAV